MTPDTCTPPRARKNPPGQQRNQVGVSQCSNGNCDVDHSTSSDNGQVRKPTGWTRIDNAVLPVLAEIGDAAAIVYLTLKAHADKDGVCWPTLESVAELAKTSTRTVIRKIEDFVSRGLLTKETRNTRYGRASNVYRFTSPSDMGDTWGDSPSDMGVIAQVTPVSSPSDMGVTNGEQDPENKIQETRSTKRDHAVDVRLVDLVDKLNSLPDGIRPSRTQITPKLESRYRTAMKTPELREALADPDRIVAAFTRAKFAHGKPWANTWGLLGAKLNSFGKYKLVSLLNGDYDGNGSNGKQQVPDDRFDDEPSDLASFRK